MSLSTYYLNQRISILQAEINALQSGGLPTTSTLAVVLANGNSAGTTDLNMNLQDIIAVDNINLVTINGSAYPPPPGTATNLAGGVASEIPFQSAPSVTGFIANGTSGQYLKSNGTATPSWDTIPATPTITQVLTAGNNALDVTQTFSATGSPTTTNIDDAEVEIIDGTSGINSKLEYDRLTLAGTYAFYATSNVVSNTGMVLNLTDTLNNFTYTTTATNTDLNIQRQIQSTFITETTGANFADGIFYQTNDTFTSPLDNTKLSLKASSTAGTITCFNPTTAASAPLDFQASALTLNGNPIPTTTPSLNDVLLVGNNAFGQSITGLNNVDLLFINSTSYPPATPSWNDTLSVSATVFQPINLNNNDINSVNNINLNTINGLTPTTIGLNWGDFTGSNAYANLPGQAYQVQSFSSISLQFASNFQVYDSNINTNSYLYTNQLVFQDVNSGTSTTYTSNSIQSTNGTDFTITAGTGASTALRLDCSQLIINGVAYSAPPPPPLRWGYYQNTGQAFSASSGTFTNVGVGSSPIQTLSGMTPLGSYTIAIQFNCWVDSADTTSSCYINYSNNVGSFTGLYDSGTPCPNTTATGVYPYGSSTQFTIQDTLIFTASSSGDLGLDLFFGTTAGFSGNYKWSLSAQIVTP